MSGPTPLPERRTSAAGPFSSAKAASASSISEAGETSAQKPELKARASAQGQSASDKFVTTSRNPFSSQALYARPVDISGLTLSRPANDTVAVGDGQKHSPAEGAAGGSAGLIAGSILLASGPGAKAASAASGAPAQVDRGHVDQNRRLIGDLLQGDGARLPPDEKSRLLATYLTGGKSPAEVAELVGSLRTDQIRQASASLQPQDRNRVLHALSQTDRLTVVKAMSSWNPEDKAGIEALHQARPNLPQRLDRTVSGTAAPDGKDNPFAPTTSFIEDSAKVAKAYASGVVEGVKDQAHMAVDQAKDAVEGVKLMITEPGLSADLLKKEVADKAKEVKEGIEIAWSAPKLAGDLLVEAGKKLKGQAVEAFENATPEQLARGAGRVGGNVLGMKGVGVVQDEALKVASKTAGAAASGRQAASAKRGEREVQSTLGSGRATGAAGPVPNSPIAGPKPGAQSIQKPRAGQAAPVASPDVPASGTAKDASATKPGASRPPSNPKELERLTKEFPSLKWPPELPIGPKPSLDAAGAAEWRYQRYAYEKYQNGSKIEDIKGFKEWERSYFAPTARGGRPGRPGGPEQVAARQRLVQESGFKNVENVALGEHYPDLVKKNELGGTDYAEVGTMLEKGIPEQRERIKLMEEMPALGPNDRLIFFDKSDINNKIVYRPDDLPSIVESRIFDSSGQVNP
jgi:hypothetical protein